MNLAELKKAFEEIDLKQYNGTHIKEGTIIDAEKFVETEIAYLEANRGNVTYKPYYDRLLEFYNKTQNDEL